MSQTFKKTLRSTFHSLDRFKMNVQFRENNQQDFTTWFGTFLSLIILVLVLIQSHHRFMVMYNREDTRYQTIAETI